MISMGIVWDRATEFLSDHLAALLPVALLAIFVPISVSQSLQSIAPTGAAMVAMPVVRIGLSALTIWGQLAIIAFALDPVAGRRPAVAAANRAMLPVIGLALILLAGLVVLVLPIPAMLAYGGLDLIAALQTGQATGEAALPAGVGGALSLYLLVLVMLLLWLAARLSLINPVVLAERRWLGAIPRSFGLTRGVTLKIIGMLILYALVAFVSFLAAKFVFGSVFALLLGGDGPVTLASVLTSILVSAVLAAFSVLAAAFTGKLYLAIRDARDAIVESA